MALLGSSARRTTGPPGGKFNKKAMKRLKPYFTEASKSMKGKPEKFGLPSNEQIKKSVYAKCGKK